MIRPALFGAALLLAATLSPAPGFAAPPAPQPPALSPGMLDAMQRDLGLDPGEIAQRLTVEAAAPVVEKRLRAKLGTRFAGAWIPDGATRLTVAVTSAADAAAVRAEGAVPTVVT
ncbi:hypothetical protein AB0C31_37050, partial [Actinoplanes philippinensis]